MVVDFPPRNVLIAGNRRPRSTGQLEWSAISQRSVKTQWLGPCNVGRPLTSVFVLLSFPHTTVVVASYYRWREREREREREKSRKHLLQRTRLSLFTSNPHLESLGAQTLFERGRRTCDVEHVSDTRRQRVQGVQGVHRELTHEVFQ